MTASDPRWFNARQIGDMTVVDRHPTAPKPQRRCACGAKLSAYNAGTMCWPCEERMKARIPQTYYRLDRSASARNEEYKAVLSRLGEITGRFIASDLSEPLGIPRKAITAHLMRAEREGWITRVDRKPYENRGNIIIWTRVAKAGAA